MTQQDLSPEAVRDLLREVFSAPEYQWDRRDPLEAVRRWLTALAERITGLQDVHPVLYYLIIGVLVGVLAAILTHFAILIWRSLRPRLEPGRSPAARTGERRDYGWHMREYGRALDASRFADALAHRFAALVIHLDGIKALQAHPSKTPAEYLREAELGGDGRARLDGLVRTLYAHLFGGTSCSLSDAVRFDALASELET